MLGGADANNYTFAGFTTATENYAVNKLALTGAAIGNVTTTYGAPAATGAVTFGNVQGTDIVTPATAAIVGTVTSTSGNLAAGSYKQSVTGALAGADANNYTFGGFTTATENYAVNKLALTGASIANVTTTYGTPAATGAVSFGNVIGADVVTPATATIVSPVNSTSGNLVVGAYKQSVTGALAGADANNYTFAGFTTATESYAVNKLALTGAAIANVTTTYGTAAATGAVTFGNVMGSDVVTPATATIVSPVNSTSGNLVAGTYKQSVTGTLAGADANNYTFTGFTTATDNYAVNKLALTGAAIANVTTTYGTPAATGAVTFGNVVGADVVTPATATIVSPVNSTSGNLVAGTYKQNVTGALAGADANNYTFGGFTTAAENYAVNKLALTGAAIANVTTTYGTPATTGAVSFGNVQGADIVTPATATIVSPVNSTSGNLAAGSYKQAVGATLAGADANNYSFAGFTTAADNYTVNKLALTGAAIANVTTTYGIPSATGVVTFGNVVGTDVVTPAAATIVSPVNSTSGNLVAGTYKQGVTGVLAGTDASNYTFAGFTTATENYAVNKLALTGAAIANVTTTYGIPASTGAVTFGNVVGADLVTPATATIVSPVNSTSGNLVAGAYKQSVTGALAGADANNYSFAGFTTATDNYTVNKLALTGAAIANVTTTYGTPAATGAVSFGNVVGADVVTPAAAMIVSPVNSTSGNLLAGAYKQSVIGALAGADANNYSFAGFTTAADNYIVNKLALTGAAIANVTTTYGTLAATGAVTFGNVVGADVVIPAAATIVSSVNSSSGNLAAGTYKQSVTGTLAGADANNYSFTGFTTAAENYAVNKLALTGAAIANVTTTYGTPAATGAVTFGNVVVADVVTPATATIVSPVNSTSGNLVAGTYKQSVTGALAGADANNYTFAGFTTVADNYTVNKLALTGAAIANVTTTYGTPAATGAVSFGNVVGADVVIPATATIVSPVNSTSGNLTAGTYKQSVTGALAGTDANNYSFAGFTTAAENFTVNKLALTGAAIANVTTTYGTAAATGAVSFGNVVGADVVTPAAATIVSPVNSTSGNLVAGTYKQSVTGVLAGTDASNYTFAGFTSATENYAVNKLALTGVAIANVTTAYGTLAATGAVSFGNVVGTDVVTPATATIVSPVNSTSGNLVAGTYKQSVTGALAGADANNYTFGGFTTATENYAVNKLALTGAAIANVTTTYGTPAATGAVTFGNVVGSDVVTSATATIVSPVNSTSGNLVAGTFKQSVTGVLGGADANNYTFVGFTTATENYAVNKLALTGAAIANVTTTYGTPAATGAVSFGNVVGADVVTPAVATIVSPVNSTSGNLAAGAYKQSVTGALAGTDANNYTFGGFTTATESYAVNKLALTGAAIANVTTTYGAPAATGAVTFGNVVGTDVVTPVTATIVSPVNSTSGNLVAGTYKQSVTGALAGVDANNYSFAGFTTAADNFTVNKLALTGAAIANVTTTYGTPAATGAVTFGNVVGTDVVNPTTATIVSPANSTSGNLVAGTYKQSVAGALAGADANNYTFAGFTTATENYAVNKLALTGTAIANVIATYGTPAATGAVTFGNVQGADIVTPATATVVSPVSSTSGNLVAGSYKQSVTGALGGADANNYSFGGFTTTTANYTVTQRVLTAAFTGANRVYDASTAATVTASDNRVSGDVLTVSANAAFVDKNAGLARTINVGSIALSGQDAGNYALSSTSATATANITPAAITNVTGIAANNKVYDATPLATLNTSGAAFAGMIGTDVLTVAAASGAFTDKHVGNGKVVNITGIALGGADAGNYTVTQTGATAFANITPAPIAGVTGITASNKVYDASPAVTLNTAGAGFTGRFAGDALTVAAASGAFTDKNVANGTTVNISGIVLGGADAGNYTLLNTGATATANITPASIANVAGITANNKVYDGGTAALLSTSGAVFTGALNGDALNVASAAGAFADKHAGTGKAVAISGITLGGADAGNYVLLNNTASSVASITPRAITIAAVADSKVYDGTTSSVALPVVAAGAVATGDTAAFIQAFADASAGNGKLLIPKGFVSDGRAGANYAVSFVPSAAGVIAPKPIVVTPTAGQNKIYGDLDPTLTFSVTAGGLVGADTLGGALSRVAGENAGNYAITQGSLANSNYALNIAPADFRIQPRAITLAAEDKTKVYGAADPLLTFNVGGLGLAARDTSAIVFSGALSRAPGEQVAAGPYAITQGTLAANVNYAVTGFSNGQLTITPAPLTVTADNQSRQALAPNPPFTASFSGFAAGEGAGQLSGALVFATPAMVSSPPGNYAITPSGLSSANYTIRYVDGTLAIRQATQPVAHSALLAAIDQAAPAGAGGAAGAGVTLRASADIAGDCHFISGRFFDCRIVSRVAGR